MQSFLQKRHRLIGWGFLVLLVISIAMLVWKNRQEALWSYWTLILFLSAWASPFFLLGKKRFSDPDATRWSIGAIASGLLLGLSFPFMALPSGLLALVAWIPLLRVATELEEKGQKGKTLYFYAFNTFLLWNIIATYWVSNSSLPAGIFAIVVNSAIMGIPLWLAYKVRPLMPRLAWVPFIAFWLCFEYMHYHWELNWPWLSLGNTMASMPYLVQWYEYTGALGGSLWILILNILLLPLLAAKSWKQVLERVNLRLLLFLLVPIIASLWMYFSYTEAGEKVEVVIVQPNVEPFYERTAVEGNTLITRLNNLCQEVGTQNTKYFIFPEATLDLVEQDYIDRGPQVKALKSGVLEDFPMANIITGTDAYHFLKDNERPGRYTRTRSQNGQTQQYEIYNAAIQFSLQEENIQFYKKSKLVPGAELFPYPRLFAFLKPLIERLGGTMAGRGAQKERAVFQTENAKLAPAICYESVFGDHIAAHIQNGAEAITIITNDAWWDRTAGHIQHLHYARLRAIENRRSVARSANTGISALINQRGDILTRTKYRETISFAGNLSLNNQLTFYTKNPGWLARFVLFAGLAFFLNYIVRMLVPKR